MKKTDIGNILKIGAILLAITAVISLMLAVINSLTAEKVAENNEKAISESIEMIFGDCVKNELTHSYTAPIDKVYEIYKDEMLCGYCVKLTETGLNGGIEMMVGADKEGSIIGVKIISHSETPGLGSLVAGEDYLSQYLGKKAEGISFLQEIDSVAGATISSRAVNNGIAAALAAMPINGSGGDIN